MEGSRPIVLRCYPRDDPVFEASAHRALDQARFPGARTDDLVRRTQAALRQAYPSVVIHRREPLAEPVDEHTDLWYVYRDGSANP